MFYIRNKGDDQATLDEFMDSIQQNRFNNQFFLFEVLNSDAELIL